MSFIVLQFIAPCPTPQRPLAGKGGCVNGFGHYQYFGRGWGVQGQSGHLDTPHPGPVYFVCYNLLSSISKTSVSWKNSRRLVLVTPSAME